MSEGSCFYKHEHWCFCCQKTWECTIDIQPTMIGAGTTLVNAETRTFRLNWRPGKAEKCKDQYEEECPGCVKRISEELEEEEAAAHLHT